MHLESKPVGWKSCAVSCCALLLFQASVGADEGRRDPFNDPFLEISHGVSGCPVPEVPICTDEQIRHLAHERAQRGVSCWLAGRCRLHNAYLYDAEIIPRVRQAVLATSRFDDTSLWALGQRRRVWIKCCVRTAEQAKDVEALVRLIDDVEDVQIELIFGVQGRPPYSVRTP